MARQRSLRQLSRSTVVFSGEAEVYVGENLFLFDFSITPASGDGHTDPEVPEEVDVEEIWVDVSGVKAVLDQKDMYEIVNRNSAAFKTAALEVAREAVR